MDRSPNLDLPYLMPSQAQKHVTHNEALSVLDALVHCAVEGRALGEPPAEPPEGRRYLVAAGAAGAWAGKAGQIAAWQDGGWCFYPPQAGTLVFVKAESLLLLHDGTAFGPPLARTEWLGVNTDADAQNRLAVAGPSTLLTHDGADHRLAINKAAPADTASLIFQHGYSGRAEIGLIGDDKLAVKVSADGHTWNHGLTIDTANGNVGLGAEPLGDTRLRVAGGDVRIGWHSLNATEMAGLAAMEIATYGTGDRPAFFDFHGTDDVSQADYSSRFIRWGGVDGSFDIANRGAGGIKFVNENGGATRFYSGIEVMIVTADGKVGIGTSAPSTALQVAGAVRIGSFAAAALPAAAAVGAGTLAWVTDTGGGTLAFSNGTAWHKLVDGGAL